MLNINTIFHNDHRITIELIDKTPVISTEKVVKPIESKTTIYRGQIKKGENLSGLEITKIVLDNKEFKPRANRYLLKIVLNYLVCKTKINLLFDLPYKANPNTTRCLINNSMYHPNKKKMRDILPLLDGNEEYYIDTKGSTNSLHNLCYELLKKHNLPTDILEIHYSKRVKK